jgi:hypothetical protein
LKNFRATLTATINGPRLAHKTAGETDFTGGRDNISDQG